ncbi:MAG TPA: hypothetical protein VK137_03270 [Planctomycetaceae bacterium]|nr:hypothetical protein [Planctomycetaceae bacterium]
MAIFTRSITDNLTSLVKQIDEQVAENEDQKMESFVVLLSNDPDADEAKLTELAEKAGIKNVPLTIFDGIAGPPGYNIAEDAEVTVLLWKDQTTVVNHAFAKGRLYKASVKKVVESTSKILE